MFNLVMGIGGFILAGDSLGRAFRADKPLLYVSILGLCELFAGAYFMTAFIGSI